MNLLEYTPGTMSNSDFYSSMINEAVDRALFPDTSKERIAKEPVIKDVSDYQGEVTDHYLDNYISKDVVSDGGFGETNNHSDFHPDMKWLNSRIPVWEGSSMRTNVPIRTKVNEYLERYPQSKYLNSRQNAALASMYYNSRPSTFDRVSGKYIRRLTGSPEDEQLYPVISDSMRIGENRTNLPGLAKRRAAERNYFNSRAYGGNLYSGLDVSQSQDLTIGNTLEPTNLTAVNSYLGPLTNGQTDSQGFNLGETAKMSMPGVMRTGAALGSSLAKGTSFFKGANAGGLIAGIGNAATGLLAGKNETGIGNAMKTVGTAASAIPGIGGVVGAGAAVLGGLTNAAFGSHINKAYVNNMQQQAGNQGSFYSKAESSDQLLNDAQNLSYLGNVSKSDVGSDGWFSHKAARATQKLNDKIDSANDRAYQSLLNTNQNVNQNTYNQLAANWSAFGGPLNFTRDHLSYPHNYSWFDKGGKVTHYTGTNLYHKEGDPLNYAVSHVSPSEVAGYDSSLAPYYVTLPEQTVVGKRPTLPDDLAGSLINAASLGVMNSPSEIDSELMRMRVNNASNTVTPEMITGLSREFNMPRDDMENYILRMNKMGYAYGGNLYDGGGDTSKPQKVGLNQYMYNGVLHNILPEETLEDNFKDQPFYANGGILEGDFNLGNKNLSKAQIKALKNLGYNITID